MIISAYSEERRNKAKTPCGTQIEKTYGYEIDKKGLKTLVENGSKNVYEKIQEYLEETKIENVIARVIAGDTSMLRPDAIYEDLSNMPNNLMDAMNQIKALENTYDNLSTEMKEKYPTIEDFVTKAGNTTWMEDMGYIQRSHETETHTATQQKGEVKDES